MRWIDGLIRAGFLGIAATALVFGSFVAAAPEKAPSTEDARPPCCATPCSGRGEGPGHGPGGPQAAGSDHDVIHDLVAHHEQIKREVKDIDGGVETITTSEDPRVVEQIRGHVRRMKDRMESGHGMRHWDPLFVELFKHHDKISMKIKNVPGGVRVREKSDDPRVALLIRQHARRAVSEFVAEGSARMHEPTPLPAGYADEPKASTPACFR